VVIIPLVMAASGSLVIDENYREKLSGIVLAEAVAGKARPDLPAGCCCLKQRGQKILPDQQLPAAREKPGTACNPGHIRAAIVPAKPGLEGAALPFRMAEKIGAEWFAAQMPQTAAPALKGFHGDHGSGHNPGPSIAAEANFTNPGELSLRQVKGQAFLARGAHEALVKNVDAKIMLAAHLQRTGQGAFQRQPVMAGTTDFVVV
jgi:hypothetical protein